MKKETIPLVELIWDLAHDFEDPPKTVASVAGVVRDVALFEGFDAPADATCLAVAKALLAGDHALAHKLLPHMVTVEKA